MYLLDTNILSAVAPAKAPPSQDLAVWMERNSAALYLSVVTVAEVEDGIAKARRAGAIRKADLLTSWLQTVLHLYGARILPLDISVARILGGLSDRARSLGHAPGFADLAIAATAQFHGCIILTRNIRHFRMLGVAAFDPLTELPALPQPL